MQGRQESKTYPYVSFMANLICYSCMSPSVGHHRVMEATQGALVTMVLKWMYDLDHTSESPAELKDVQAVEDLSWRSCC